MKKISLDEVLSLFVRFTEIELRIVSDVGSKNSIKYLPVKRVMNMVYVGEQNIQSVDSKYYVLLIAPRRYKTIIYISEYDSKNEA